MSTVDAPHICAQMLYAIDEESLPVYYEDRFREYGLRLGGGDPGTVVFDFCPFCGVALPPSLRAEWDAEIARSGLTSHDPRVPAAMLTGAWWRER